MGNPGHKFIISKLEGKTEYGIIFQSNVVYGMYSGLALLMDVYQLDHSNGYGIVMIPGGGWRREHGFQDVDGRRLREALAAGGRAAGRPVGFERRLTEHAFARARWVLEATVGTDDGGVVHPDPATQGV